MGTSGINRLVSPRRPSRSRALSAVLAAALALAPPGRALAAPPRIAFESETCDLGSVAQGEQPDCVFFFTNGGTEELHILHLEPTCGCTTALLSAPLTRSGGRGAIRVVFDSENFAGEVVKEVEVRTNDPARPNLTLRVKALVEPEIDFEPRVVAFDNVRAGSEMKHVVMLTNRRAEPVRILRLEGRPSSCRCLIPAWTDQSQPLVLESWDRMVVEVFFTSPQSLALPIAGECVLEIEGPRKRDFRLKILALPAP
jgi:hypothetical protein